VFSSHDAVSAATHALQENNAQRHQSFIALSYVRHDCLLDKTSMGRGHEHEEADAMLLHSATPKAPDFRAFAAPARCARCGDVMVAPLMSEFAEGEIRHHWVCEACGDVTRTAIPLGAD
jgi:hypothetical protein